MNKPWRIAAVVIPTAAFLVTAASLYLTLRSRDQTIRSLRAMIEVQRPSLVFVGVLDTFSQDSPSTVKSVPSGVVTVVEYEPPARETVKYGCERMKADAF